MAQAYRADQLGSMLRPKNVVEARAAFIKGDIGEEQFDEVADKAVLALLERQKQIGIDVFCDGEIRRSSFQGDLADSVEGFINLERTQTTVAHMWGGRGRRGPAVSNSQVVGRMIKQVRRMTGHQAEFLKTHAPGPYKITVPSATQYPAIAYEPGVTDKVYATRSELLWDIVEVIKAEIAALVEDGVPYIQLDAPRYSYYVDPKWRQHLRDLGEDPEASFDEAIAADQACLQGARRAGATVGIHMCRGNSQSSWFAQGGYEPVAEKLFGSLPVDRILLEYDSERAGDFEPLRFVPVDKTVVLGLVSTKDPEMESQDELLRRIDEAAKYVPLERLALSPQCGFASNAIGSALNEDQQWRKLELVVDTARKVWG